MAYDMERCPDCGAQLRMLSADISKAMPTRRSSPGRPRDRLVVDGNVVSASTWHDYDTQFFKIFIKKMQESAGR